jgi:hypothetical protein
MDGFPELKARANPSDLKAKIILNLPDLRAVQL